MSTTRWTLRRRLVLVVVALLAAMAAVTGLVSALALRASLIDQIDQRLVAASDRATRSPGPVGFDRLPPGLRNPQEVGTVVVSTVAGRIVGGYYDESGSFQPLSAEQTGELLGIPTDGSPHTVGISSLGDYRAMASSGRGGATVVTGLPMADAATTVRRFMAAEVAVLLLGLVVAGVLAAVLVRRELRPLVRVSRTAGRIAELPLERGEVAIVERVPSDDADPSTEVGQVGSSLNRMIDHVENALTARQESETQVRQFVADASHELRTPLASIRGYAELVRRLPEGVPDDAVQAMARVESESVRMTELVDDMLLLARLDAGRDLDSSRVDLSALAVDAVADAHAAGPDHVWQLDFQGDETEMVVLGDEPRLRQVLANLLSNARSHTPAGTTVVLALSRAGEWIELVVRDDGPGISDELTSRLFQRFSRGDTARARDHGSTGLGLAIVEAVVVAHGGSIDVDGTPGATTFTVSLPAAPAAD